jgi:hypothetical protein
VNPDWFNPNPDPDPAFSSIRIRIHKIFESGFNADPDPQRKIWRQFFPLSFKNQYRSKNTCS